MPRVSVDSILRRTALTGYQDGISLRRPTCGGTCCYYDCGKSDGLATPALPVATMLVMCERAYDAEATKTVGRSTRQIE